VTDTSTTTDPNSLAAALEKDSLFKKFDGYAVLPRDLNIYFFMGREPFAGYYLTYDSRGAEYMTFAQHYNHYQDSIKIVDSVTYLKKNKLYMEKAYELITIMKSLKMYWVNSQGTFECLFNDSLRLRYYPDTDSITLDPRIFENIKRIDRNFICYQ
jgi:hypothetical protein